MNETIRWKGRKSTGCINEEGKPNTGGRSTSNGASTTNQEEGRNQDDDMKWRRDSLKWRETWETRRLEGNAHEMKGLGFGWIIMRCSFSKEDPMQQIKYHFTLPYLCTLRDDTTTRLPKDIALSIYVPHLNNSLMLPLYLA